MNPFEAAFHLTHNVSVYVPSTVNVTEHVDNTAEVQATLRQLSELFGGCTAYQTIGAWIDDNDKLIVEDVTVCQSYVEELSDDGLRAVYDIAINLRETMHQKAVSVSIDNGLYFV